MNQITTLFMGSQGSGKGTQAALLEKFIKEHDGERDIFIFDTGPALEELGRGDYFISERVHESILEGELQPSFLAGYVWSKALIENYTGKEHVILQGSPRTLLEAQLLNTALDYYRKEATMIYLKVSEDTARKRLLERGRPDDTEEGISERLTWFNEKVIPVINFYRDSRKHSVIEVDAEQSIEEVHEELIEKLGLV